MSATVKKLPMLAISTTEPCFVEVNSEPIGATDKATPAILPVAESGEYYITIWPIGIYSKGIAIPSLYRLKMVDGVPICDEYSRGLKLIDWDGLIEVISAPSVFSDPNRLPNHPVSLGSIKYQYRGAKATVELYYENGIRISVDRGEGTPLVGFAIGEGNTGELGILDVGKQRLLTISIKADDFKRLVILNGNMDTVLDVRGDLAGIIDGYPTVIHELGTVKGHQKRIRHECRGGGAVSLPAETGFFTRSPADLKNDYDTAVAFCEAIMLKRFTEAFDLLSEELRSSLEIDDLKDFLGDFKVCRAAPIAGIAGTIIVGVADEWSHITCPRLFQFETENGHIANVNERPSAIRPKLKST